MGRWSTSCSTEAGGQALGPGPDPRVSLRVLRVDSWEPRPEQRGGILSVMRPSVMPCVRDGRGGTGDTGPKGAPAEHSLPPGACGSQAASPPWLRVRPQAGPVPDSPALPLGGTGAPRRQLAGAASTLAPCGRHRRLRRPLCALMSQTSRSGGEVSPSSIRSHGLTALTCVCPPFHLAHPVHPAPKAQLGPLPRKSSGPSSL